MKAMLSATLAAVLMAAALGCGLPELFQHHDPVPDNPDPRIATMYDAPPIYAQWWATAESCAHKRENMQHLRWYAVASPWLEVGWEEEHPDSLGKMLPYHYNIVYIRRGRTLDRTEVMAAMVLARFTPTPFFGDHPEPEVFGRILACAGISTAGWIGAWRPNPQ